MREAFLIQHIFENMSNCPKFFDKEFILDENDSLTYKEFYNRSMSLSQYIINNYNLAKGDRILVLIDNCINFYISYLSIVLFGGIVVPLSPRSSIDKVIEIANDCGASAILCSSVEIADKYEKCFFSIPVINVQCEYSNKSQKINNCLSIIDIDPAMIIYTSGSTGKSKGIICSHLNVLSAVKSISSYLDIKEQDVVLNTLPPFFDYGLYQFFLCSYSGAKLVLQNDFIFVDSIINCMEINNITILPLMPTIATSLIEYIEHSNARNFCLDSIRIITSTGAKLYSSQIRGLKRNFVNASIFSMYGLTECKRVSYLNPMLLDIKPDSVGKPMPNVEIDIVNNEGVSVPVGEVGRLIVKGSNVCLGYWNDPELTSKVFITDKFNQRILFTNDLFRMDADGDLFFVSRIDDIIKCSGYRISIQEISQKIMNISGVKETFIETKEDERLGKKMIAYVVLHDKSTLTPHKIKNKLLSVLESSAVCPQEIIIVDSIPVSENGKLFIN